MKEINLLEYKQNKENLKSNEEILKSFTIDDKEKFKEYYNEINILKKYIDDNNIISTNNDNISIDFKVFLQWLGNRISNYCNANYMDINLFENNDYFKTIINLKIQDTYCAFETIYYNNDTIIRVYPTNSNAKDIIDIDWIEQEISHPNFFKNRNSLIKNEVKSIMEMYDINSIDLKDIIKQIEKDN